MNAKRKKTGKGRRDAGNKKYIEHTATTYIITKERKEKEIKNESNYSLAAVIKQ